MNQYFREVLKEGVFSISDVFVEVKKDFPALKLSKIEPLFNTLIRMKVLITAISYNTITPKGDPIVSSGLSCVPSTGSRAGCYIFSSANIDKFGSGSMPSSFEGVLSFWATLSLSPTYWKRYYKRHGRVSVLMAENTDK